MKLAINTTHFNQTSMPLGVFGCVGVLSVLMCGRIECVDVWVCVCMYVIAYNI